MDFKSKIRAILHLKSKLVLEKEKEIDKLEAQLNKLKFDLKHIPKDKKMQRVYMKRLIYSLGNIVDQKRKELESLK